MKELDHEGLDEVFRRAGRNLLRFQKVEGMLKFLLADAQVHGYAHELVAVRENRRLKVQGQTLGNLISQFTGGTELARTAPSPPQDLRGAWMSFSFELDAHPAFQEQLERHLTLLLAERNELVHHLLAKFDLDSLAGRTAVLNYLDRQQEVITPAYDSLARIVRDFELTTRATAEFMVSPEVEDFLERTWLPQSQIVDILCDIATQEAGPGGWTPLGTAGRLLRQRAPNEVDALLKHPGHHTLKALMQAFECFELREQTTSKGGTRLVYRVKVTESAAAGIGAPGPIQ